MEKTESNYNLPSNLEAQIEELMFPATSLEFNIGGKNFKLYEGCGGGYFNMKVDGKKITMTDDTPYMFTDSDEVIEAIKEEVGK